jgi:hypothetical protein
LASRNCNSGILYEVIEYLKLKLKILNFKFSHVKDVALIMMLCQLEIVFGPIRVAKFMGIVKLVV